mmetsp:Transcript_73535/g.137405  ORF Transcript_73535/g.137405 Transcript_73535/m.137405 type:complete len:146 (-) Transcript_73535:138-575(-)
MARDSRSPRRRFPSEADDRRERSRSARRSQQPVIDEAGGGSNRASASGTLQQGGGSSPLLGKAEVVDGKPRASTGEPTWRAEILMPQSSGYNYQGKVRTMCIRGPHRVDREQAVRDAEQLEKAAESGDTKAVKGIANDMIRSGTH